MVMFGRKARHVAYAVVNTMGAGGIVIVALGAWYASGIGARFAVAG
jgi:hypothetical protein